MYAVHQERGAWQLMMHENAFVQILHESGDRGDDQLGSINWLMGMAQQNVADWRIMFRGTFSAEPWTGRGCGYRICSRASPEASQPCRAALYRP